MKVKPTAGNQGAARSITERKGPGAPAANAPLLAAGLPLKTVIVSDGGLHDADGLAARRYDAQPGTAYLRRPDQHICARWRMPTPAAVADALRRAQAQAN